MGQMKTSFEIRYVLESKVLQDAPVKLSSSFFPCNQNNAGPVCIAILSPR